MNRRERRRRALPPGSVIHVRIGRLAIDGALAADEPPDLDALQNAIAQRLGAADRPAPSRPDGSRGGTAWCDAVADSIADSVAGTVADVLTRPVHETARAGRHSAAQRAGPHADAQRAGPHADPFRVDGHALAFRTGGRDG